MWRRCYANKPYCDDTIWGKLWTSHSKTQFGNIFWEKKKKNRAPKSVRYLRLPECFASCMANCSPGRPGCWWESRSRRPSWSVAPPESFRVLSSARGSYKIHLTRVPSCWYGFSIVKSWLHLLKKKRKKIIKNKWMKLVESRRRLRNICEHKWSFVKQHIRPSNEHCGLFRAQRYSPQWNVKHLKKCCCYYYFFVIAICAFFFPSHVHPKVPQQVLPCFVFAF